jgi:hypothetical protein
MLRLDCTRWLAVLLAGIAVAGCSSLPEIARPRGGTMDASAPPGDWIRYRPLERSDFRRKDPPPVVKQGPYELGAQTCAYLKTNPDVRIDLLKTVEPNGSERVEGRLTNLRFEAWMDRECSWWNPTNHDVPYTLEHEQIHFAISEIAARKLNREAAKLVRDLHVTAGTQEEVVAEIQGKVKALLEEYNDESLERNEDFDQDTSVGKNPPRQKEWRAKVNEELGELDAWK